MDIGIKKGMHILLSLWLIAYGIVASGHFGHKHVYSRTDAGFCLSQCHDPIHHNLKPDCKGFPANLIMGVDAHPNTIQPWSSEFQAVISCKERPALNEFHSTDHSRAPPFS